MFQRVTAHQARDLRYYRRYNFESVPMADYEIRDVMNRWKHPTLKFEFQILNTTHRTAKIFARIWNTETVIAQHCSVAVLMPTTINGGQTL